MGKTDSSNSWARYLLSVTNISHELELKCLLPPERVQVDSQGRFVCRMASLTLTYAEAY